MGTNNGLRIEAGLERVLLLRSTGGLLAVAAVVGLVGGCKQFELPDQKVEPSRRSILGPGLGNLTYTSGELNKMVSPILLPVNAAPLDGTPSGCPTSRPAGATAPDWGSSITADCRGGHF